MSSTLCLLCGIIEITTPKEGRRRVGGVWIDNVFYEPDQICTECMGKHIASVINRRWANES
jgi:hypothetical protein|tara:strand:+ start:629 stop:811 length:183 start_codon:yes stop_codon:yes gene_type:complete